MNTNKILNPTSVSTLIENAGLFDQVTSALSQGRDFGDISKLVYQNLPVDLQNITPLVEIEKFLIQAFSQTNLHESHLKNGALAQNETTKFGTYDISAKLDSNTGIQIDGEASMVELNDQITGANVKFHTVTCESELSTSAANVKCEASAIKIRFPQEDKNSWGLELRGPTTTVGLTAPIPIPPVVIKKDSSQSKKQSKKPQPQTPKKTTVKFAAGTNFKTSVGDVRLKTPSIQIGECDFDVTLTGSILTAGSQAKITDRSAEIFLGLGRVGFGAKVESDCSVF